MTELQSISSQIRCHFPFCAPTWLFRLLERGGDLHSQCNQWIFFSGLLFSKQGSAWSFTAELVVGLPALLPQILLSKRDLAPRQTFPCSIEGFLLHSFSAQIAC